MPDQEHLTILLDWHERFSSYPQMRYCALPGSSGYAHSIPQLHRLVKRLRQAAGRISPIGRLICMRMLDLE